MEMERLCHPYIEIMLGAAVSYGGNQTWSSRKTINKVGCGGVAFTDLLIYLSRSRSDFPRHIFRS